MLIPYEAGEKFTVSLLADEDGACEALDYLEALAVGGKKEKQDYETLTRQRIVRMAQHGAIYNPEQSKELEDGIYEFKAPGGSRLLWFYDETQRQVVICTHGFHKPPSNKGYRPEIRKAKEMRVRYLAEVERG